MQQMVCPKENPAFLCCRKTYIEIRSDDLFATHKSSSSQFFVFNFGIRYLCMWRCFLSLRFSLSESIRVFCCCFVGFSHQTFILFVQDMSFFRYLCQNTPANNYSQETISHGIDGWDKHHGFFNSYPVPACANKQTGWMECLALVNITLSQTGLTSQQFLVFNFPNSELLFSIIFCFKTILFSILFVVDCLDNKTRHLTKIFFSQ